jgi:hypothetical protein
VITKEQSDYEYWLAFPHTKALFALIAKSKQSNLEILSTTDDEKEGSKLRGEIRNQNNLLDLNRGDAYAKFKA